MNAFRKWLIKVSDQDFFALALIRPDRFGDALRAEDLLGNTDFEMEVFRFGIWYCIQALENSSNH